MHRRNRYSPENLNPWKEKIVMPTLSKDSINTLKVLLSKEVNDRKVYSDALEAISELDALTTTKDETERAISGLKKERATLDEQCDTMALQLSKAKEEAAQVRADAQNEAQRIVADANVKAQEVTLKAEDELKAKAEELASLEAKVKAEADKLANTEKDVAAAEKKLEDIRARAQSI